MGFQVHVRQPTGFEAVCQESGCGWQGPTRQYHQQAEDDAAKHIQAHYDRWEEYNEQIESWEPGDPIVEYDSRVDEPNFGQSGVCGVDHSGIGWGAHHS